MTTPAEYREFALDCMRWAEAEENAAMRAIMMGLARVWMRTSLEVDRYVTLAGDEPARSGELRKALN